MTSALTIKKKEISQRREAELLDFLQHLTDSVLSNGSRAAAMILASPIAQMIGGLVLVEYLQTIQINSGEYAWQSQPGTHALAFQPVKKPLLTNFQADSLETIILTTSTLNSLGSALAGLGKLLLPIGAG